MHKNKYEMEGTQKNRAFASIVKEYTISPILGNTQSPPGMCYIPTSDVG